MMTKRLILIVAFSSISFTASAQDATLFEQAFRSLSIDERKSIQSELADYGAFGGGNGYKDEIDGLWGRNTANAIVDAYKDTFECYSEDTWDTEAQFLNYILEPNYFWGEGDFCEEDYMSIHNERMTEALANSDFYWDGSQWVEKQQSGVSENETIESVAAEDRIDAEQDPSEVAARNHLVIFERDLLGRIRTSIEITEACEDRESKAGDVGTEILELRVTSETCFNVSRLSERNYSCFATLRINFNETVSFNDVTCRNGDSEVVITPLALSGTAYGRSDLEKENERSYDYFPSEGLALRHADSFLEELLLSEASAISYNCNAINACVNTVREVSQYLVDNLTSINELTQIYGDNYNWKFSGISKFGEKISVFSWREIAPDVLIQREQLDNFNGGSISLN